MKRIVFLLEEPSMKEFLDSYLPRMLPGLDFLCVKHEGKQDLEKSIPRKLRAWQGVLFVVVRDNDGAACRKIKSRLQKLCRRGGHPDTLVRIACQEIESWYLGAPDALAAAYSRPKLSGLSRKAKYRDPDALGSPSLELSRLIPEFRKMEGARLMGQQMPAIEASNRSRSFQVFFQGVRRIAEADRQPDAKSNE
jgi:hypothetical protein